MKLPLDNLNYPVRILIGNSSGSAFLIRDKNKIYLVTAKHVLYRQDSITKNFTFHGEKLKIICYTFFNNHVEKIPIIYEIEVNVLWQNGNIKSHNSADAVVVKLGEIDEIDKKIIFSSGIVKTQHAPGFLINYDMSGSRKFDEVDITNDIFVLGYPSSLSTNEMRQIDYNSPLVRKGIVAGKNYENRTLILDCPVYGGNSGGLVLEMNETGLGTGNIHLIGVVVQFVPFVDQWRNVRFPELYNINLQNSGYSVALPVDYIYELISEIEK